MKRLFNILITIVSSLIIVLSLAFIVIEGRLLISLDWIIYDNNLNGFIRYFFRFIIALICLAIGLLEIINRYKKNNNLDYYLLISELSLVISSVIILAYSANYIGQISLGVSSLLAILRLLERNFIKNKTNC
jgi:hypothetical protein